MIQKATNRRTSRIIITYKNGICLGIIINMVRLGIPGYDSPSTLGYMKKKKTDAEMCLPKSNKLHSKLIITKKSNEINSSAIGTRNFKTYSYIK